MALRSCAEETSRGYRADPPGNFLKELDPNFAASQEESGSSSGGEGQESLLREKKRRDQDAGAKSVWPRT